MDRARSVLTGVDLCDDPYQMADGVDALILVTDWDEFRDLDLERLRRVMRTPVFVDGRNVFEPGAMRNAGFVYAGIGRGFAEGQLEDAVPESALSMAGGASRGRIRRSA
jgi:UDPglucose 6-dehydrogenase